MHPWRLLTLSFACPQGASVLELLRDEKTAPDAAKVFNALGGDSLPQVRLEIYPSPECPNCLLAMEQGILPFLRAGLPGDQVVLTVLPWGTGAKWVDGSWHSSAQVDGLYDQLCGVELCGLREAASKPAAVNSEDLLRGVSFMACHMREFQRKGDAALAADPAAPEMIAKRCSSSAGLPWHGKHGMRSCQANNTGVLAQHETAYTSAIGWVYQQPKWTQTPFLFLNGPSNGESQHHDRECDSHEVLRKLLRGRQFPLAV